MDELTIAPADDRAVDARRSFKASARYLSSREGLMSD